MVRNLRLTCHHLYAMTRGIWTETYKNRFLNAIFPLDPRGLGVLLSIVTDNFLLSQIRVVCFYKARIFFYQVRLD